MSHEQGIRDSTGRRGNSSIVSHQSDSLFAAIDALQKNTLEVQNQHNALADSLLEDVILPLRLVADKSETEIKPLILNMQDTKSKIERLQRNYERVEAKVVSWQKHCSAEQGKLNKELSAMPVSTLHE